MEKQGKSIKIITKLSYLCARLSVQSTKIHNFMSNGIGFECVCIVYGNKAALSEEKSKIWCNDGDEQHK